MVMDYLKERSKKSTDKQKTQPPGWTSDENYSLKAWEKIEELKKEKAKYIKNHTKVTDFLIQKNYRIKGEDIAKALNANRSSLMNTSDFSPKLKQHLDKTNAILDKAKDLQLEKKKKNPSRGSIKNSKAELVKANTALRKKVEKLEAQKTEELVSRTFDELPLPIKKKLGIS